MDKAVWQLIAGSECYATDDGKHVAGRYMTRDYGHEKLLDKPVTQFMRMIEVACAKCNKKVERTAQTTRDETEEVMPAETHGVFVDGEARESRPAAEPG